MQVLRDLPVSIDTLKQVSYNNLCFQKLSFSKHEGQVAWSVIKSIIITSGQVASKFIGSCQC